MSRRSAPIENSPVAVCPDQSRGRAGGAGGRAGRARSSVPRSCSGRRTISSTASPRMARMSPALPLIGGGAHPVPAGVRRRCRGSDRARRRRHGRGGTIYELGGPEVRTLPRADGISCSPSPSAAPAAAAAVPAREAAWRGSCSSCRTPPLTPDQVRLLERDNVVSEAAIREGRTLDRPRHRAASRWAPSFRATSGASARPASSAPRAT